MVAAQLQAVRVRIADAARRVGRPPESVRLVCVTKSATLDQIREALAAGAADLGEGRVQEARSRIEALGNVVPLAPVRWPPQEEAAPLTPVRWHMIGHLQRNKAKLAVELFDWVHAVDDLELAQTLDRRASALGRRLPVLIEVNTSGEATKYGVPPQGLGRLLDGVMPLSSLDVRGLMTMAPPPVFGPPGRSADAASGGETGGGVAPIMAHPSQARPYFAKLRELAGQYRLTELSMGMSQDFEVAVEEGATIVRVGSAIFT